MLDVRRRVKGVLAKLGVLGLFEGVSAEYRNQFFEKCQTWPKLAFDPSFPTANAYGGAYADLHAQARAGFAAAEMDLGWITMTVSEYFGVLVPLAGMCRTTLRTVDSPLRDSPPCPKALRAFLDAAWDAASWVCDQDIQQAAFNAVHREVVVPLVARSRLDGRLLHGRFSGQQTFRGQRMVFTLYSEHAPMQQLRMSNGQRRAYRMGTSNVWNGIEWANWSRENVKGQWAEQIGLKAGEEWAVWVQGHALDRLRSRLDTYAHADWSEHWMYESLKSPKIVGREPGGDLLVAYEVMGQRLGYLVVSAREGMVAVRTFLFLTMRNTPEGRELARRLKLTRDEMDYLRLHELSRFTRTDLKDDPELRKLFKACGCGHLFKLAEDEHAMTPGAQQVKPFAAELREYVGLAA